jgi:hypothetical protein
MYSPTTPVTGAAQTGLTSPTYTITVDVAPSALGKQHAVTALGGTQTGVRTSAAADPFTVTAFRPQVLRTASLPNPVSGVLGPQPKNVWKVITRKGVLPLAGQSPQQMLVTTIIEVPAGADTADAANVRAALSLHFGVLSQQSAGLGDSAVTGVL